MLAISVFILSFHQRRWKGNVCLLWKLRRLLIFTTRREMLYRENHIVQAFFKYFRWQNVIDLCYYLVYIRYTFSWCSLEIFDSCSRSNGAEIETTHFSNNANMKMKISKRTFWEYSWIVNSTITFILKHFRRLRSSDSKNRFF